MRYRANWVDLKYEAAFRIPLFAVTAAPLIFAEAMCVSLRSVTPIAARDISVTNVTAVDTRVKASLFKGNADLEIGPDSLSILIKNIRNPVDFEVIKNTVASLQTFVNEQARTNIAHDDTITARAFLELVETPKDGRSYLSSLTSDQALYGPSKVVQDSILHPAIKFDIQDNGLSWGFNFELSRSYRNAAEIFVLATTSFPAESKLSDLGARAELVDQLVSESMERFGLEPAPGIDGTSG